MALRKFLACTTIIGALAASSQAGAAGIVIGLPSDQANCFPFSCTGWGPEYQQVYAATNFSNPITIKEITFYLASPGYNNFAPNGGNYNISLSTTAASVTSLSPNLADNIGADNTLVFNGNLPSFDNLEFRIFLSTPFTYNPAAGNLLLDVYSADASAGQAAFEANGTGSGLFSRAYAAGVDDNFGLVTGFNTVVVPEPATWAMLILGLAMVGFAARRRTERAVLAA